METSENSILVLCTGNSCRSQMMEGWLKHFSQGQFLVKSAGIETHGVNPRAIQVMAEAGVDISSHTSDHIDSYLETDFDVVLTVCDHARERCPVFPSSAVKIHHSFTDPAGVTGSEEEILHAFRSVRDEIKSYAELLVNELSLN